MIGDRIQQARQAAAMSQRSLGDQLGLSAMAISKYENNKMAPGSEVLLRLAEALGVRTEYFFRSKAVPLRQLQFRKHPRLPVKLEKRVLGEAQDQLELWADLEDIAPSLARPQDLNISFGSIHSYDDLENVADLVRTKWQLGTNPIFNLVAELEDQGIKVIEVDGDDSRQFDGLLARANDSWVIVVRRGLSGDRQRFTLAHELGHILLDGKLPTTLDLEKACNRFAGAFLVPRSEAFRVLGTSRRALEPVELQIAKHEWGLSMAGWVHRAEELGIVNDSAVASLWAMFRSEEVSPGVSWRVREPGTQYPSAAPSLFRQSVFHALAEGLINESKAAELLGITLIELRSMRKLETIDASSDH